MALIYDFNKHMIKKAENEMSSLRKLAHDSFYRRDPEVMAGKILNESKITLLDYPINPVQIANSLGIRVIEYDFPKNRNVSGSVIKRDENIKILVNSNDPLPRQRFTIAHELGHALLHLEHNDGTFMDNNKSLYRADTNFINSEDAQREKEANAFAAALLMPARDVKNLWSIADSLDDLAKDFGVSRQAMQIRLENLGLIK